MSKDIYNTPELELICENKSDYVLATRGQRFLASIVDGLTIGLITLPAVYFTDGLTEGVRYQLWYSLSIGALGLICFFLMNAHLLRKNGQTIGKKILGIKIVDLSGNLPSIKKHLLVRYAVLFLPGQASFVGQFFFTVNILFILGKQKRCLHDYIAGTNVIVS